MRKEHGEASEKPKVFRRGKSPLNRPMSKNGKSIRPRFGHRFYINTLAPLLEDPWRWIRFVIGAALLLGIGFFGAAIADYFISGALDMQSVENIRVVYYNAANEPEPPQGEDAVPSGPEADEADYRAMKSYLALKSINPDAVGWLSIPGTQIDYPVAQGQDNRYYLKHSFQKKQSAHACIFLDWRNEPEDLSFVIYGHDMKDGTFFGSLSDLHDEGYCREHQIIELNLWGEATRWKIFSVRVADDTIVPVMFGSFSEYAQYLKSSAEASEFDMGAKVGENDTILTLSTCDSGNSRLLVQAVRVE